MADGLRKGLTSYGDAGFSLFLRKAFIKAMGYSDDALNRPIVGITNTHIDYNPCHGNAPQLVEAIKRGVMLAGGLPVEFPTISIAESFSHPTSMYLRNLMSMDTEEMIRAQPMDAVVVIGGCDKTLPAQIMAAVSADLPTVVVPVGPMVVGHHKGEVLGACTDCRRLWAKYRAGEIDDAEIEAVNGRLAPSVGTCMVMGTASTMACITEALGLSLPMSATIPAPHAERFRSAEASGKVAAAMAMAKGPRPSELLTLAAFRNAQVVLQAIGGSTNGLIHLTAIANRTEHRIDLEAFDRLGREVPVLIDLKPSGAHYMEHFHHAGGVPKLMAQLGDLIDLDAKTITGATLRDVDVAADDVLVLRNAGPKGAPGMPEAGYLPIPMKLARAGVKDMVRISDARMSGTAFGTIVLHITPESAVSGPLALVKNGDMIRLDVARRSIDLLVDAAELEKRRVALAPVATPEWAKRGYAHLFNETILQADEGCDFDFMRAKGKE